MLSADKSILPLEWVLPPGKELAFEEVRKRKLFAAFTIPGVIILITFGVYHLFQLNLLEGCLDLLASLWLMFGLLGLRLTQKGLVIYRINTILLGLLFLFLAAKGGIGGNKLLWMFSYPLIAFYTLGIVEGLAWTGSVYALCMGILFWPLPVQWLHAYSLEFKIRFGVAFALVASMTYIYESARRKSQSNLENEQRNLKAGKQKLAEMTLTVQTANRALTLSEQRLKQAQSIAGVGNFEYDPETDRLWGSEEALRIFGLEHAGRQLTLNDLNAQAPEFYSFIEGFGARQNGTCKFRIMLSRREATAYQEKIAYARVERGPCAEASSPNIIGVVQDITALHKAEAEKKELEAKLARSQKMEALGLLAGGVAHDLNNVLSGIVSYPDIMLMRLPGDSDLRKPLGVMRDSGQKAAAIVQDLLTLARRGVTNLEVLDLNDLIDEYLGSPEFHKLQSYHPQVEIKVNKDATLSNISASTVHMKKSLMNLVSNAAEALPKGGRIQISTQNRFIDRPLKGYTDIVAGEYVVIGVEDNGNGIPPEDMGRIFEPFFTKKKMGRSGTGLGLAVVWGTVEDHNGYIDVSSAPDEGSLIELYLPVTSECLEQQNNAIHLEDYRGNGESILVVDDMQTQRDITSEMLIMLGYRVQTAAGGEEAITFLKTHTVDLVILDMIMDPGIDGLETYTRMRALRPEQKTLIVSGYSESGRVKQAQMLGAGAYVKKPFNIQTIGLAIRRELNN
jgi:signal transduction histidine kinase